MTKKIGIYLAGTIQKQHETKASYWTEENIKEIRNAMTGYTPIFLNPAIRTDDITNSQSVFGRDMMQVFSSHVVFVDARERRGLGVGAEMMWAKANAIPVVTWAPENSYNNKKDTIILGRKVEKFLHPFVYGLSDAIVETPKEGAIWITKMLNDPSIKIKNLESVHEAMSFYREHQLDSDFPMQEILSHEEIFSKAASCKRLTPS